MKEANEADAGNAKADWNDVVAIAPNAAIDAQLVVTGRGCVLGQSGSGKSYLIGVIIEELCRLHLPFAVVDTEGEYVNIKEKFKAIWIGESANADMHFQKDYSMLKYAIEGSVPVILDVSEAYSKEDEVYAFARALYTIEEKIKKPFLLIIEEADKFVPQQAQSKIFNPIEEISVRGRKRGIGLLIATQRPARVSKNVLSQCSYGFIGKLAIRNDLYAVKTLLENEGQLELLPSLQCGEFVPFGLNTNEKIKVKERMIAPLGSTPKLMPYNGNPAKAYDIIKKGEMNSNGSYYSMQALYSIDDAKKKAMKWLLKLPRIGWHVDSASKEYAKMFMFKALIPKARQNEYIERYILAGNEIVAKVQGRKLELYELNKYKFTDEEKAVLGCLMLKSANLEQICNSAKLDEISALEAIDALEEKGLVYERFGRFKINGFKKYFMQSMPVLTHERHALPLFISTNAKKARDMLASAFYGIELLEPKEVYLPFYRVTLRKGNRIRILLFDGIELKERAMQRQQNA